MNNCDCYESKINRRYRLKNNSLVGGSLAISIGVVGNCIPQRQPAIGRRKKPAIIKDRSRGENSRKTVARAPRARTSSVPITCHRNKRLRFPIFPTRAYLERNVTFASLNLTHVPTNTSDKYLTSRHQFVDLAWFFFDDIAFETSTPSVYLHGWKAWTVQRFREGTFRKISCLLRARSTTNYHLPTLERCKISVYYRKRKLLWYRGVRKLLFTCFTKNRCF